VGDAERLMSTVHPAASPRQEPPRAETPTASPQRRLGRERSSQSSVAAGPRACPTVRIYTLPSDGKALHALKYE